MTDNRGIRAYKVLQDYKGYEQRNLQLQKGDYVTHVKVLNKEWALGRNRRTKKTGSFPLSFIDYNKSIWSRISTQKKPTLPVSSHNTTIIDSEHHKEGEDSDSDENEGSETQSSPQTNEEQHLSPLTKKDVQLIKTKSYHKKTKGQSHKYLIDYSMNEGIMKRNAKNLMEELKLRLQQRDPTKSLSYHKWYLFKRIIVSICGILLGALFCGALFSICVFSFGYTYKISGIITGIAFLLVLIGVSCSKFLSCCLLLVVPALFTTQGRTLLLAAIFILLMSGPGANIAKNTVEVSRCLACVADLIQNQLLQLAKQIIEPIYRVARALQDVFHDIVSSLQAVVDAIETVVNGIQSFLDKVVEVASAITGVFEKCTKTMDEAKNKCKSGIQQAEKDCDDALRAAEKWLKDAAEAIAKPFKAIGSLFGRRRRHAIDTLHSNKTSKMMIISGLPVRRPLAGLSGREGEQVPITRKIRRSRSYNAISPKQHWAHNQTPFTRSTSRSNVVDILSANQSRMYTVDESAPVFETRVGRRKRSICSVLGVLEVVCNVVDIPAAICSAISFVSSSLESAAKAAITEFNKLKNEFVFGLNASFDINNDVNSSKTATQIVTGVLTDIASKFSTITSISAIMSQALGVTVIFLFIKSVIYMTRYMKQDFYDNIYISPEFVEYDEKCKRSGRESILPLKYKEHAKYIITTLPFPTTQELSLALTGLTTFFTHFGIAVIVIGFNYALYYLLVLIERYGQVAVLSSSLSSFEITVEGTGFIANFLRNLIANLDLNVNMTVEFNITQCLPNPSKPSESDIPVFSVLYGGVLFLVFIQMYSLRIRRAITSHFFPDRERERCRLLHELIRHQRKSLFTWVRQRLHIRSHDVDKRVSLRGLLEYSQFGICCKPFLDFCLPRKATCISCEEDASGNVSFRKCTKCKSLYCKHCFEVFQNNCLVCNVRQDIRSGK